MTTKTVIACIDGSALSEAVCDYAAWIAQRVDAPLKLLHTIDHHHEMAASADLSGNIGLDSREHLLEEFASTEQQQSKLRLQQGKALLKTAKQRVIDDGIAKPICCLQHGNLVESLAELEESIRVLVIGVRGKIHQDQSQQIGAKLEAMIRSIHRPILVAYEAFKTPERIMIAYDGSEAADKAVDMVATSPLYKGLICHLVYVSKNPNTDNILENVAIKLLQGGSIEVITANLQGKAEDELCKYQSNQNIDMTIMGAFSHTRLHDILLGSFTHKMIVNTKKPLLLFR